MGIISKILGLFYTNMETDGDEYFDFDRDLNQNFRKIEEFCLNKTQITNCITQAPRKIKYSIEDGVLTIKAGSIAIIPHGTEDLSEEYPVGSSFLNDDLKVINTEFIDGNFFVWVELTQDKQTDATDQAAAENRMVTLDLTNNALGSINTSAYRSGTIEPSGLSSYYRFYNTATNYIYNIGTETRHSLPLLIGESTNGVGWTKVRETFENFGIIGSSVFMNKGIKGLIPNGRNEDKTLKNIEFNPSSFVVKTYDGGADYDYALSFSDNEIARVPYQRYIESDIEPTGLSSYVTWFNPKDNVIYEKNFSDSSSQWTPRLKLCGAVIASLKDGIFTSLKIKEPFRAVNYSDRDVISGFSFPNPKKYISLTLGATGLNYTAPANGYFQIVLKLGASKFLYISYPELPSSGSSANQQSVFGYYQGSSVSTASNIAYMVPVRKGQKIKITYDGEKVAFNFIYAEGAI